MNDSLRDRLWRGDLPWLAGTLWPLEQLYRWGAAVDRTFGRRRAERVDVPVVSVGNLVAGGAGKTPVTLLLARRLLSAGRRVGVISRGYGRTSRGLVTVSNGAGAVITPTIGGDEPVLLARKEPRLVVAVAERRIEAARACVSRGCDVIVMDDGFSHHQMHRDLDVLVVDADLALGNGRMLPAGPLREPLEEARRAELVWRSRMPKNASDSALPPPLTLSSASVSERSRRAVDDCVAAGNVLAALPRALERTPTVGSGWRPVGLSDASLRVVEPLSALPGARVAAFCAIARPEAFRQTLTGLGAELVHFESFADHHAPSPAELERFRAAARAAGAERLLCTEKDLVRLDAPAAAGIGALAMEAYLLGDEGPLDAALARVLGRFA